MRIKFVNYLPYAASSATVLIIDRLRPKSVSSRLDRLSSSETVVLKTLRCARAVTKFSRIAVKRCTNVMPEVRVSVIYAIVFFTFYSRLRRIPLRVVIVMYDDAAPAQFTIWQCRHAVNAWMQLS